MTWTPIGDVAGDLLAKLKTQMAQHFPEKGAGVIPPQVTGGNVPDCGSGGPSGSCGTRDPNRMKRRARFPSVKRGIQSAQSQPDPSDTGQDAIHDVRFR